MECSICLNEIFEENHTTPCNHIFHKICIINIQIPTCPICRFDLTNDLNRLRSMVLFTQLYKNLYNRVPTMDEFDEFINSM